LVELIHAREKWWSMYADELVNDAVRLETENKRLKGFLTSTEQDVIALASRFAALHGNADTHLPWLNMMICLTVE
jgi:hypothetical protein